MAYQGPFSNGQCHALGVEEENGFLPSSITISTILGRAPGPLFILQDADQPIDSARQNIYALRGTEVLVQREQGSADGCPRRWEKGCAVALGGAAPVALHQQLCLT